MTRRHQSDGHHARGPRVVAGGLAVVVATFAITAVGSAAATTLYVNGGNAGCSNTGPGTSAQPFCTIGAAALKVTAGQTVEVAAGTYPERVAVSSSGTSSAPIVFTAAPGATVTVSGQANGFAITGRSWVTVNGFKVTGTGSYGITVSSSWQITLSNNDVSASGQRVLGQSSAGIHLAGVTDSVVRDNVSHDNSDHGILLSNVLTNGSTRVTVDGNRTFNNARGYERAAAGIRLSSSAGNTVSGNISYGNEDSGIESYLGSNDTLLYNNVTYANGDHGIDNNRSTGQRMIANSVYKNETAGINVEGASTGATIANNVSVDNAINNTLRQKSNIRVDSASISGTTMDYDLVQLTTAGTTLIWNSTGYSSLASFQAATGQESHGLEGDPKWKSPGTGDFHLTSGSPAIDSANSGVPGQPSADVEGNGRIDDPATANTGVGPRTYDDRGAYEYGTAVGSPPDTSPPDTSITSGPSGTTSASSASFGFSSTEAGSTFECRLDSGAWAACSAPKSLTGLSDGSHTFSVRATDAAGNTDPSEATRTWNVDTAAPDTTISSGPSGTTTSSSASFDFSSTEPGSAFECRLDSGAWAACSAPKSLTGLSDGSHTLAVRAIDPAGNADPSEATRTWTVDTTAPDTSISEGPSGTTSDPTPSFTFSSDAGSTFECKIDSGAWISCSAPFTTPPLTDGGHTFSVRATDAAGNTDQIPAARSFTVNTASPPAPALAPVPKTGPAPPTVDQIGAALHGNLAESAKALRRLGIARLLRRRGFTAQGLDALLAGKFSATLTGAPRGAGVARKIVLATGARSVPSAGRYSLKLKLTRQGMRLLRSDQTAKITVTIKFRDASGRITTARERLRLRR